MNARPRVIDPPPLSLLYEATLQAMAEHSVRKPGLDNIARLAGTHRSLLYRHWPRPRQLHSEALAYGLDLLLRHADEPPQSVVTQLPPLCELACQLSYAARLVRDHPLTVSLRERSPDVLLHAVSSADHPLYWAAKGWLHRRLSGYGTRSAPGTSDAPPAAYAPVLLLTLVPLALCPSALPEPDLDRTTRALVHGLFSPSPDCSTCVSPAT
ncbi:TetR/AcrR family transcriptional regulator [Streptomyces sp. NPDC087440]|uniref:TetR/AcrR family transcriptional regulator n=1 Tax=Streptomyces sp. NPDC087440 TaxID=3365790 RepID=UPI0037F5E06B